MMPNLVLRQDERQANSASRPFVVGVLVALTELCFRVFFFSSRRRHTRWNCDWSSDVCSSDLRGGRLELGREERAELLLEDVLLRGQPALALAGLEGVVVLPAGQDAALGGRPEVEIGRASCRERV